MLIRHLHHLTLVARHGSIAGAAKSIPIAQPALSRELRRLERELDLALLHRERRGVRFTGAGHALVADAEVILERLDRAVMAAREAGEGRRGTVRIAMGRLATDNGAVGLAIASARRRFSGVRFEIGDVSPFSSPQLLLSREADITISSYLPEEHRGLRTDLGLEDVLDGAMVSASHPLARATRLTLAELRDHTYLGLEPSFRRGYSALIDALRGAGITRTERHATVESLYALVAAGRGWAVATRAQRAHPPRGTTVVPLDGLDVRVPQYVRRRARDDNRVVENIAAHLLGELRGEAPGRRARTPARGAPRLASPRAVELRQLEAFVAAVEEGSLSQAAERLSLTQSGISRRLRALERAVGFPLLHRVASGVAMTPAGGVFRDEAVDIRRAVQQALSRARRSAEGERPSCRIGALPPELTNGLQLLALQRLVVLRPDALFEVVELLPDEQIRALRERRIDVAIMGGAGGMRLPESLAHVALNEDPVECAMVAAGHPWSERAWVTHAELATEPFLFIPRAHGPRLFDAVLRAFADIGLTPRVEDVFSGPRAVWRSVASGMGWTIGSRSQRSHPPEGLVAVPVEGLQLSWGVHLCWRRDERDPLVRQVLDVLRDTRNPDVPVVVATVRAELGPRSVSA